MVPIIIQDAVYSFLPSHVQAIMTQVRNNIEHRTSFNLIEMVLEIVGDVFTNAIIDWRVSIWFFIGA
jgi:hypothetical protein